jgi:DUF1009 family protein
MTAAALEQIASPKLGIIAGQGRLPLLIAETYRSAQKAYFLLGIEGFALNRDIASFVHGWTPLGALRHAFDVLKAQDCEDIVMAGRVARPNFKSLKVDRSGAKLVARIATAVRRGDDAIMKLVVDAFEQEGFNVLGVNDVLSDLVIEEGPLGEISPTSEQSEDIDFAIEVVRQLGHLDIGQGAVVSERHVIAVEAIEGTDVMLERCASFPRHGKERSGKPTGVFVKMPKAGQERRVDLPVIGARTVKKAAAAGLAGIAVAAGGVLVIDPQAVARVADDLGLFIIGFSHDRTIK